MTGMGGCARSHKVLSVASPAEVELLAPERWRSGVVDASKMGAGLIRCADQALDLGLAQGFYELAHAGPRREVQGAHDLIAG